MALNTIGVLEAPEPTAPATKSGRFACKRRAWERFVGDCKGEAESREPWVKGLCIKEVAEPHSSNHKMAREYSDMRGICKQLRGVGGGGANRETEQICVK